MIAVLHIYLSVMLAMAYMAVYMRRQMDSQDYRLVEEAMLNSPDIRMVGSVRVGFMHAIKHMRRNLVMLL